MSTWEIQAIESQQGLPLGQWEVCCLAEMLFSQNNVCYFFKCLCPSSVLPALPGYLLK